VNDDLRTTFTRAADDAVDGAMTADQIRRAAAERIRAKRRRRPFFVVGSAVAGLTLVGGGAFAAVQLLGDDPARLPDVIGSPQPGATPSETTAPAEPTTEPAESEAPVEPTAPTAPEPAQPAALPQADPTAVFPACGALVQPTSGSPDLSFSPVWAEGALGDTITATLRSGNGDHLSGALSTHLTAVAVKDGVVVGSTEQVPSDATVSFDLEGFGSSVESTGSLAHTLCSDGATPLPAGRYSVWVSQRATVTERAEVDETGAVAAPVATSEDVVASRDVASLWIDDAGRSVPSPGVAQGWPPQVSQEEAFRTAEGPEETVVWLAVSDREYLMDVDPALYLPGTRVLDLGYVDPEVPFKCQYEAPGMLGVPDVAPGSPGSGVGVIFADRGDAELFASQWESLHGPVVGIVTSAVWCSFS